MARPTGTDIDDRIDAWHAGDASIPLHEALGWSLDEYLAWLADPSRIPDRPLPHFNGPASA